MSALLDGTGKNFEPNNPSCPNFSPLGNVFARVVRAVDKLNSFVVFALIFLPLALKVNYRILPLSTAVGTSTAPVPSLGPRLCRAAVHIHQWQHHPAPGRMRATKVSEPEYGPGGWENPEPSSMTAKAVLMMPGRAPTYYQIPHLYKQSTITSSRLSTPLYKINTVPGRHTPKRGENANQVLQRKSAGLATGKLL